VTANSVTAERIGVVIVDYYTREHTLALIADLAGQGFHSAIVVDNTGDSEYRQGWASLPPWARLIASAKRAGFGAGVNLGAAQLTGCDILLVLNSDIRLISGDLVVLAAELLDRRVGVLAPRIVDRDGVSQSDAAGPFLTLGAPDRKQVPRTGWVTGACFLTPVELFCRVGGFDERFFMYWEDVDYCRRLADLGFAADVSAAACVMHVSGASELSRAARYTRASRSRDLYLRKWNFVLPVRIAYRLMSLLKLLWLRWSPAHGDKR